MAAPALVGRDDAIGGIRARLRDIAERGGALVIRGPAGIGKTALLETGVNDARSRNLMVLATAGVESETYLPYAGLHQLLRPVLGRADSLPRPQREALLTAFGMLDGPAPELFLVGLAVLTLLTEAAAEVPLVLIADDAHWFDAPTAAVLAFVARRLEADPVLLLAVIRDGFEAPLLGLGLAELRLEPLDAAAAAQLLDAHAPDLAAADRKRVLREAAGNPLALLELPRALRSQAGATGQILPPILPLTDRLQTAFAARAAQLPLATRTALLVAAADDRADASEVLAATAHLIGSSAAVDVLEPAAAAALITVDQASVRFRHPLVRSALYHSASLGQRHAAHRALAEVLASEPDRRAWHRAAAIVGPDVGAAAELEGAARRARDRGATLVAVVAQERAASLTADPPMRARRWLDAAEMGFELGQPALVARLLDQAERLELGPRERARSIWLREIFSDGVPGDAGGVRRLVGCADEALQAGDAELALKLLHGAGVRCWWADPGGAARELVVTAARRVGAGPADPRVLEILALAAPVDSGALVTNIAERAVRASPTSAQAPDEARQLGFAAHTTGDVQRSFELLGQAAPGFRHQGRLGLLAQVLTVRAWDAIHLGRFDDATRDADEGGRLALETGQPVWTAGAQIAKALLAGVRGDDPLAEALGAQAERAILPLRLSNLLAVLQLARGLAALSAGRYADAHDQLRRMFDPRDVAFNQIESYAAVGYLAEAAMHAERRAEARDLMAEIEALGRRTPAPLLHVGLGYARAVLADDGDAEELYATALGTASAWPFDGARLHLAYGAWLRRRRRVAESRDPLRMARDAFDRLGARPWTDRARRELRASGERTLEQPIARPEALSPQELQIARMAADGLSNREIGERLFVSHRTVGSHLYRIFPKLGIVARSELRTALADPAPPA